MSTEKVYYNYIQKLNLGKLRYKEIWFAPDLKSTKIMTQLKHRHASGNIDENCEGAFDVLYINIFDRKYYLLDTLVIIYIPEGDIESNKFNFTYTGRAFTFTSFKKTRKNKWFCICSDEPHETINLSNGKKLKLWNMPYILDAVTNYDKDFRKEWIDGDMVYTGNEYGDTSRFYIIGCIEH